MTKKILLSLVLLSIFTLLSAQRFTGVYNYGKDVCCFSQVNWEITCQIKYETAGAGLVNLQFPSYTMSVANAKYQKNGKQYSPSELGLSRWPEENTGANTSGMYADISVFYNGKLARVIPHAQIVPHGIQLGSGYVQGNGKSILYFGDTGIPKDEFKLSQLTVSLSTFSTSGVNPGWKQIDQLIANKENGTTNTETKDQQINLGDPTNKNTSNDDKYISDITKETYEDVLKTVEMGGNFISGLISDAKEKKERETRMKLDIAETSIESIKNCNTAACNNEKGDTYKRLAEEGFKNGLKFGMKYNSTLLRIAIAYYNLAANGGNANALESLIYIYNGAYTKNNELSKAWTGKYLTIAENYANDGYTYYISKTAAIYRNKDYAFNDAFENKEKAFYWLTRSAEAGNETDKYDLADVYYKGKLGQEKNYQKALKLALEICDKQKGRTSLWDQAAALIIDIYKKGGFGVEKDKDLAKEWSEGIFNFYETFKDNKIGWNVSKGNASNSIIQDDKFIINNSDKSLLFNTLNFSNYHLENRDIEINTKIRKTTTNTKYIYGLIVGSNNDGSKYHTAWIGYMGSNVEFSFLNHESELKYLIKNEQIHEPNNTDWLELKFKKINQEVQVFLNNKLMGTTKAETLFGDKFGFIVTGLGENVQVEIEDYWIREIRTK